MRYGQISSLLVLSVLYFLITIFQIAHASGEMPWLMVYNSILNTLFSALFAFVKTSPIVTL